MAKKDKEVYDPRGTLDKLGGGDFKSLDVVDGLRMGATAAALVPGPYAAAGDLVAAPFGVTEAIITSDRDYIRLSALLDQDLQRADRDSPGVHKKLNELSSRAYQKAGEYGLSAAGAGAGYVAAGALAGSVIGPVGTIGGMIIGTVGAMGGGMAAHYLYDEAFKTQDQDAVELTAKIREAQAKGAKDIPPEIVFAALAANLPEAVGKRVEDRLQQLTGTRMFHEAVAQGKTKELQQMMREFDDVIRADTYMPLDPDNLSKTTAEQYAQLLNNGQLDARALLFHPDRLPSLAAYNRQVAAAQGIQLQGQVMPVNNELQTIAGNLLEHDVTVDLGGDGNVKLAPLPGGRGSRELP